jgi:GDP-L-fucose synthase
MDKNAKIYIAGHAGLVGSSLMRNLKALGYNNIITKSFIELDLRQQSLVNNFFEQEKPDYVFLAAAKVGGIQANNTYPAEFIYDNIAISTNIIHASYKYGIKKLLNLGSSCIYPKFAPQPIKEEYLLTGSLEKTNEPYAIAKIAALKMCEYYNKQYQTNFMSLMPTNLYGQNDNFDLETAHVLPALIRKFHLAKLLKENNIEGIQEDFSKYKIGQENINLKTTCEIIKFLFTYGISKDSVVLWGSGKPFREFLFVDDLAQGAIFLMNNVSMESFINIGTGNDISIKDLALLIKQIVGFEGQIEFDINKPDGTPKKLLDVSKIHALNWKHKTDLKSGIEKTYQWYIGNTKIYETSTANKNTQAARVH